MNEIEDQIDCLTNLKLSLSSFFIFYHSLAVILFSMGSNNVFKI